MDANCASIILQMSSILAIFSESLMLITNDTFNYRVMYNEVTEKNNNSNDILTNRNFSAKCKRSRIRNGRLSNATNKNYKNFPFAMHFIIYLFHFLTVNLSFFFSISFSFSLGVEKDRDLNEKECMFKYPSQSQTVSNLP